MKKILPNGIFPALPSGKLLFAFFLKNLILRNLILAGSDHRAPGFSFKLKRNMRHTQFFFRHAIYALLFAFAVCALPAFTQYRPGVNHRVSLLSRLDSYSNYSNIWGYTDAQGREYALLGTSSGLSIVNITDPKKPVEAAFVPGPFSPWREIKTHRHYAYVVSEGRSPQEYTGVQIVNLSGLPNSVTFHSYRWPNVGPGNANAHTVAIDEAGYLYVQGGTATLGTGGDDGGVRIFNLANPEAPEPVSFYSSLYVHDSFVKNNILFNSNINEGGRVDVLDLGNRARPRLLTSIVYPRGFSHNSGTTEDGNYLITTDEVSGYTVKFWDIRVLWDNDPGNDNNLELVAEYLSNPGKIAHNVHVRGNHVYIAHYDEGVRVLDISDPRQPAEVGYYITPSDWGVYPHFPSHNFVVSDIPSGLYVFRFDSVSAATVEGRITNAETGEPISGAAIHFLEADRRLAAAANGSYRLHTSAGAHQTIVQAFPFKTDTATITLNPNAATVHDRALQPLLHKSAITGVVRDTQGNSLHTQLTLHVSSNTIPGFVLTAETDAQGQFAFNNIFESSPPLLSYDRLVIQPEFPYPIHIVKNIPVRAADPTVLNFVLSPADIMLVNDDPDGRYAEYYLSALEKLQRTAFLWSPQQNGSPALGQVRRLQRQIVIWYTGDARGEEALNPAERDSIAAFLDRGGKLWLTGQNIAESLKDHPFLANRLHTSFVRNNVADYRLHGVSNDPIGHGLQTIITNASNGANNQNSQDVLQPDALAQACVVFDTVRIAVAGVRVDNFANRSRLVFFGFGFEAVNIGSVPQPQYAAPEAVLRNVLNWLDGVVSVEEPPPAGEGFPSRFELSQGYPNPLALETAKAISTIRYQLPAGREVHTLVDETYKPGSFTTRWNGRDARGVQVKSGVYFYKLTAGALQQVRKLAVVR